MGISTETTKVIFDSSIAAKLAESTTLPRSSETRDEPDNDCVSMQSDIVNSLKSLLAQEDRSTAPDIRIRT